MYERKHTCDTYDTYSIVEKKGGGRGACKMRFPKAQELMLYFAFRVIILGTHSADGMVTDPSTQQTHTDLI